MRPAASVSALTSQSNGPRRRSAPWTRSGSPIEARRAVDALVAEAHRVEVEAEAGKSRVVVPFIARPPSMRRLRALTAPVGARRAPGRS